jgi:hypothetical protein
MLVLSSWLLGTGCGQPNPVDSSMSSNQKNALTASLRQLEETLATKSPYIFAKLGSGATNEQLLPLRSELGGAQIECLELWYQWHNGCTDQITNVLPLGRMLSIAEAIDDRRLIKEVAFVDAKRKNAWKILDDGAGDGFFLEVTSANPRVFYHMLEDPYPRDYGTLQEFVAFIDVVHAAGVASEDANGMVEFDDDRYQKIEAEYLAKLGQPNRP